METHEFKVKLSFIEDDEEVRDIAVFVDEFPEDLETTARAMYAIAQSPKMTEDTKFFFNIIDANGEERICEVAETIDDLVDLLPA